MPLVRLGCLPRPSPTTSTVATTVTVAGLGEHVSQFFRAASCFCVVSVEMRSVRSSSLATRTIVLVTLWLMDSSVAVAEKQVMYHLLQNNYSFDALQAYCFGIYLKL